MDDNKTPYWLCCGSLSPIHEGKPCYEARTGHPEHVRFGTAKQHSEWQKKTYKPNHN